MEKQMIFQQGKNYTIIVDDYLNITLDIVYSHSKVEFADDDVYIQFVFLRLDNNGFAIFSPSDLVAYQIKYNVVEV
ncbi:hypothetical protein [Dolichospermum phage Dfl-JY23]